jgi:hypothetical protein
VSRPSPGARRVALGCAAVAVLSAGIAVAAAVRPAGGRPSVLVRMSPVEPMAPLARAADPDFVFVPPSAHYDGVYYYAIARDPLAVGVAHTRIDDAAYRYAHAGYGLLAWLVSVGQAAAVPTALLVLSLGGIGVAAWTASRVADLLGLPPWGGLAVAFSPGLLFAATASTSETVGAALLGTALLAWLRGRWPTAAVTLALLCLTKEMFVLAPLGLALWEWTRGRTGERWRGVRPAQLLTLAAGPVALAAWFGYLRLRFGTWPLTTQQDALAPPGAGWGDTLRRGGELVRAGFAEMQVGSVVVPLLVAAAGLLAVGAGRAAALRTPLDAVYLALTPLVLTLGPLTLLYPKELLRNLAIPLLLLPAVLVTPSRKRSPPAYDAG